VRSDWPWDEIRSWQFSDDPEHRRTYVAGSNPAEISRLFKEWPTNWHLPEKLGYAPEAFPLKVDLPEPGKAGIDRLLNAVAANCLREKNRPVLIVDSGTATTVDAVNAEGHFLGGAILPGFELSARALHQYTALLPLIPLDDLSSAAPPTAVGNNTRAAMRSGLYWGQVGAVKELLDQSARMLSFEDPLILATGGGGEILAPRIPGAIWMPHLSLQGLALVVDVMETRAE
jgi:type III pantothenate kinase